MAQGGQTDAVWSHVRNIAPCLITPSLLLSSIPPPKHRRFCAHGNGRHQRVRVTLPVSLEGFHHRQESFLKSVCLFVRSFL